MKKTVLMFIFLSTISTIHSNNELSQLFDTSILKVPTKVQEILTSHGFQKVCFTTQDNFKICGLFIDQSKKIKIKGTILYCAGFYPGTKEGMASFFALLADKPYNFLFFDARGHQESDGKLLSYQNIKQYGSSEYQDIVAAIDFLNTYNTSNNLTQSIVIHGICSGAFHCMKAVDHLAKTNCTNCYNIKGIIFDSGWLKLVDIVEPTICAEVKHRFKNTYFSWLIRPTCWITKQFYRFTLKSHHQTLDGIEQCMTNASCPIFFIHCLHDPYVPAMPVQKIADQIKHPYSWWIEHESHGTYHLKQQQEFKKRLEEFLNTVME
ncbi:MAG: alpha/beta hydrolase [Candidatus Babeliales bacterium]|jgi:pimeloyl-ACP methyl ester carboxylesterase